MKTISAQQRQRANKSTETRTLWFSLALALIVTLLLNALAHAGPSEADFLRSMSESVSGEGDGRSILPIILVVSGVVLLLCWLGTRERKAAKPGAVNHARKLLKQVSREVGLAGTEVRQLKLLADAHERGGNEKLASPLTLLLCPSVLAKTIESADDRVERPTVARMVKRLAPKKAA